MNSPSRLQSLRWRLPISYAAIALLAVLALGIALLGVLREFYREQERAYLQGNAIVIAGEIAPLLAAKEKAFLQSQIAQFSFLTQTRIEVLDEEEQNVLVDSDKLDGFIPSFSLNPDQDGLPEGFGLAVDEVTTVIEEEIQSEDGSVSSQRVVTKTNQLSAEGSLYGFTLGEAQTAGGERSNLSEVTSIVDESGEVVGQVRLSQGPAYGNVILRSVAKGWAAAGIIAVLLAALAGWLISHRLTQPLFALTAVTGQMAGGDLSVRADIRQTNELGMLGKSFNQMADQVENTVTTLSQFAADAAHELHTPLTALQTDLQLLTDSNDPIQQQRVQRAQSQAARLQSLADGLLDLSRLEAEPVMRERPLLNLNQLLQVIAEPVASQAEQAGLEFELSLPKTVVFVRGDAAQLQQALRNLLDNSLKFTPSPGNIYLSLQDAGETAVVDVRDTGIGIPPEDLPKLFGRFHRGKNSANYPGNGLGLAIVKAIVTGHDGQVIIENQRKGVKLKSGCQQANLASQSKIFPPELVQHFLDPAHFP